jgi:hypothetical protein
MRQGLHEEVLVKHLYGARAVSATLTDWNGTTQGGAAGIDLVGFDEAVCQLNLGAFASGTLDVSLYDSATDLGTDAAAILDSAGTAAAFAQMTSASANKTFIIRIRAKDCKRYLFVRAVNADGGAKSYSINILLAKATHEEVTQTNAINFKHEVA